MPFNKTKEWIDQESELGSPNPSNAVLSTVGLNGFPHGRVVAVREFTDTGFVFFTQRDTRKVAELNKNPRASLTFWLALRQRQIIIEGTVLALTPEENQRFWQALPRERQLRFSTYAPISGQPIGSILELEVKAEVLSQRWAEEEIPMSEFYYGFRLVPETFYFYTVGTKTFSEVSRYTCEQGLWMKKRLSP